MFDDHKTPAPDPGNNLEGSFGGFFRASTDMRGGAERATFEVKALRVENRDLFEVLSAPVARTIAEATKASLSLEQITFPLGEAGIRLLVDTGNASSDTVRDLFLVLSALHQNAGGTSELTMTITGVTVRGLSEVLFHPKTVE